jgi:hypothetical protein
MPANAQKLKLHLQSSGPRSQAMFGFVKPLSTPSDLAMVGAMTGAAQELTVVDPEKFPVFFPQLS